MNELPTLDANIQDQTPRSGGRNLPRLGFPIICLLVFWIAAFVAGQLDKLYFFGFLYALASSALITLAFAGWWWLARGLSRWEKFLGVAPVIAEAWMAARFTHHTIN